MSHADRYDPNNVFARILRGEIPAFKVYESDTALAFMDAMPQSDGHTLVIPKVSARSLFDIEPDALAELIKTTQRVALAVRRAFRPDGMRLMQFNEAAAGQTVFHIHFHIIPCYAGVELKGHSREFADQSVLQQHAERVRQALAQD
ncbi:MAG TPA: HIT family protein [Steroidobacter sp.]|jgi:histidine triad (HIT) family protein|nr:HIT family protein [Steroidobacteraceae bacterium]HLS82884.1 HIT family protein [Steroidobacter sp.]